jgi:hypothetical protein
MSHPDAPNSGYASSLKIDWSQIETAVKQVSSAEDGGAPRVALLNFDDSEVEEWRARLPHTEASTVRLDPFGGNVTWEHLYPEWIDEEELYGAPSCPDLPEPAVAEAEAYDVVAVKLPCGRAASWSKDVARLHLQLAAARVAARHGRRRPHVLVVSRCFPAPNLFKCRDEVARDGDVWLYRPDAEELDRKLALPVGSCELAMPFKALGTYQASQIAMPFTRRTGASSLTAITVPCRGSVRVGGAASGGVRDDPSLGAAVRVRRADGGAEHPDGGVGAGHGGAGGRDDRRAAPGRAGGGGVEGAGDPAHPQPAGVAGRVQRVELQQILAVDADGVRACHLSGRRPAGAAANGAAVRDAGGERDGEQRHLLQLRCDGGGALRVHVPAADGARRRHRVVQRRRPGVPQ